MKHLAFRLFVPTLAALSVGASAQTIDNLSSWSGSGIGSFGTGGGYSSANTFGQTFVAPAQSYLASWETAFQDSNNGSVPFTYRFYIAPWNSVVGRLGGVPVFTSGNLTSPSVYAQYMSLKVDVNLLLTPGVTYVAFTSTSEFSPVYSSSTISVNQAGYGMNNYLEGGFVQNASDSFANLTATNPAVNGWDTRFVGSSDTAFRATFQAVPEPAPFAALGLGTLAFARRQRRASGERRRCTDGVGSCPM